MLERADCCKLTQVINSESELGKSAGQPEGFGVAMNLDPSKLICNVVTAVADGDMLMYGPAAPGAGAVVGAAVVATVERAKHCGYARLVIFALEAIWSKLIKLG